MEDYLDLRGLDGEPCFGHSVMRADNRHGNDWHSTLHREVERALLEREQLAVEGALTLDVDDHVEPLIDDSFGGANGFNARIAIAAVDGDERSHSHGSTENRRFEQFLLHHERRTPRNERNLDRRIEIRNVVGHEDVAAGVIETIEADGLDAHARNPYAGAGSPHKQPVEQADVAGDERPGKSDQRRHWSGKAP